MAITQGLLDALNTELTSDPDVRGYASMSDEAANADLNEKRIVSKQPVPKGLLEGYMIQTDLYLPITEAVTDTNDEVRSAATIFSRLGSLSIGALDFGLTKPGESKPQIERSLDALVGALIITATHRTEILSMANMTISKYEQLSAIGQVCKVGSVISARGK